MKKIKIIIPTLSCLFATALFSCANNSEQPESDYYTISISNAHKSPDVVIEGSNKVKKGEACDVFIRVEPFTYFKTINYHDVHTNKYIRVCKANRLSLDEELDDKCYDFKPYSDDYCVWELKIAKEYMTTSYVVDINSCYVEGYNADDSITLSSELEDKAEITVVNTEVDSDLTFFVTPTNFQSGYTFDDETINAIEIKGIPADENADPVILAPSRKELVLCDSPIQGLGHYQTQTKQLRIAIPMTQLFTKVEESPEHFYGYKQTYDHIEVSSGSSNPVVYNETNYKNIFNPTIGGESCTLVSKEINLTNGVHYIAKFEPENGYHFPVTTSFGKENFPITDLSVLPGIYTPTGHPYFREFEVHKVESKQGAIKVSPYEAYIGGNGRLSFSTARVLGDTVGNIYVPMGYDGGTYLENNYWLDVSTVSNNLVIDINITDMVKYVEFPTTTIIAETDLIEYGDEFYKFYQDGSIDFIQSVNFTVKAIED